MPKPDKYAPTEPAAAISRNGITSYGPHKIKHGSITLGIADLMGSEKAPLIYSDPPWGAGNVRYWQTINNKMTGASPQDLSYADYMQALFSIIRQYASGVVLMEYGQKWADQFIDQAATYGLHHSTTVELLYRSGSRLIPCDLHVFGLGFKPSIPHSFRQEITHTHGYNTLKVAFRHFAQPGKIVLDPCCGMGYTAQAALDHSMVFRGNELNAARLQVTANRLFRSCKP